MAIDIDKVWAENGDITVIPEDTQPDGSVSFEQGHGSDYGLDPGSVPNAKRIEREEHNYLLNVLFTNVKEFVSQGFPNHIVGKSYNLNNTVLGTDDVIYKSTINGNIATPPGANWVDAFAVDLSNYIAKDNTISFTPTGDYNPATKKYVDDNAGATPFVGYYGYLAAHLQTSGTILNFTTVIDTENAMFSGVYIIPVGFSGKWRFAERQRHAHTGTAASAQTSFLLNSVRQLEVQTNADISLSESFSIILNVSAGDAVSTETDTANSTNFITGSSNSKPTDFTAEFLGA